MDSLRKVPKLNDYQRIAPSLLTETFKIDEIKKGTEQNKKVKQQVGSIESKKPFKYIAKVNV